MSILNAMYSGASGLSAEGEALGVVGDNVANTSTVGFKQSRAVFEDVLNGAAGQPGVAGGGVRMSRAQQVFAQGSMTNTGQPTDLAISGDGFFVVSGSVGGMTGTFFSRAGQNSLRKDGTLVDVNGLALQGYAAQAGGTYASAPGSIVVPTAALLPNATTKFATTANLDATAAVPAAPWDPQNPRATSNFSTSMRVFDSLGNAHTVDVYFAKTGAGTWDYHALAPGGEVTGGTPGTNFEWATGSLTFGTNGALQTSTLSSGGTIDFVGATPGQAIALQFGTPTATGGTGLDGLTQFGSPSTVSAQSQDGYASGDLSGVRIDSEGVVRGVYTNGQQIPVAKLAIAKFVANDGLGRAGHGLWMATRESGEPAIGAAGTGGRGAIVAGALEQSNVDIATQFVDLIAHQRAFQANSKTITTADQMLQDLMHIKQ